MSDKNSDTEDDEEAPAAPEDGNEEENKPPLEGEMSQDNDPANDKMSNETCPSEGDKASGDDDKESGSDYEVIDTKFNEQ